MKTPWANTILLALVLVELATGFFGLVSGSRDEAVFIAVHRIGGFAILVVLVWKVAIIVASVRRRRSGPRQYASLALAAVLAVTLALGFAWSHAGPFYFAWFSGLSWHIYVGAALAPVLAWHAYVYARRMPTSFWAQRRWFLRLAGMAAAGVVLTQAAEATSAFARPEGSRRRFTGSYDASRQRSQGFPVVSWLNDSGQLEAHANRHRGPRAHLRILRPRTDGGAHGGDRLHWRLVLRAVVARRPRRGPARRCLPIPKGGQRHRYLRDRVLPPLLDGRGAHERSGHPRRRRATVEGSRLPPQAGGAGEAGLRVGQVGDVHRGQRIAKVAPASLAAAIVVLEKYRLPALSY